MRLLLRLVLLIMSLASMPDARACSLYDSDAACAQKRLEELERKLKAVERAQKEQERRDTSPTRQFCLMIAKSAREIANCLEYY